MPHAGNKMFIRTSTIFLTTFLTGPVFAQPADSPEPSVHCDVAGYDILITNSAPKLIAAGTVLNWSVRFARSSGKVEVAKDMKTGDTIFLTGVLGSSYLRPGTPCQAFIDHEKEGSDPT